MFKLESGKSYLTRGGKIVNIKYDRNCKRWPYYGDNDISYLENGSAGYGFDDAVDIVMECKPEDNEIKHSHYKKDVSGINVVDIYDVLNLFEVQSHPVGHAIKKLLMAGKRGAKGYSQDIQEAIDSLNRELEMTKGEE